ncbi:bifunctional IQ motif [Babesia duncani]|uniref:Bifunctional IQ motif n=1 Tax=Babesia duncani TaxID=323732 RepID=A0AAD9PJ35_9APIC|nr:bifunctional IQ motif [Babesia duncani]
MSSSVVVGSHLFVACSNEVWKEAIVDEIKGGDLIVKVHGPDGETKLTVKKGDIYYPRSTDRSNTPSGYPDDLTNLTHLHEASVLHSLDCRFQCNNIYTFTGKILIAVNPFQSIPGLYSEETIVNYLVSTPKEPHVFSVAKQAYTGMTNDGKSQTILISGESGAGKTESTKICLKFLATAGAEEVKSGSPIQQRVLQSNPLLETFGNASTLRNANSSRFGKFIELQFQKESPIKSKLCGAKIETYLLEKVRVCQQLEGERNYHIFHQLFEARKRMPQYKFPQLPEYQHFTPWEFDLSMVEGDFRILPQNKSAEWDKAFFEETVAAMQTIGLSHEHVEVIFSVVIAVLHLCNIEFMPNKAADGAAVNNTPAAHSSKVSELLCVDGAALLNALLCRTIKTAHELYTKPLTVEEACFIRDAIAKHIYYMVFDHICDLANKAIGYMEDEEHIRTCGVLDIFGFECFTENSFEQLCINFTNETLQNFFNDYVFKCEALLYEREGISWNPLDFPDNTDCIQLFKTKPNGLFIMIDEECHLPGGKDQNLVDKIFKRHPKHVRLTPVKTDRSKFIVNHFAGSVKYSINGFLEKNKDQLSGDAVSFILSTKNETIKEIFDNYYAKVGIPASGKRCKTIATQFSAQLDSLMAKISKTQPHFIRCIKPNDLAKPLVFNRNNVNMQLRCSGMLQVVQVSRAGYPVRWSHDDLLRTFKWIIPNEQLKQVEKISDAKKRSSQIIEVLVGLYMQHIKLEETDIAVGQTLVFMKNLPFEQIHNALFELKNVYATKIQCVYKGMIQRRWYVDAMTRIRFLQTWLRFKIYRIQQKRRIRLAAIVTIQSMFRMYVERRTLRKLQNTVLRLQSQYRSIKSQEESRQRRINEMATKIQATFKGFVCRRYYIQLLDATIKAQLRWRSILARKQLRSLRMEAKSLGTMIQKNQELQQRLTDEVALREDAEAKVLQLTAKVHGLSETVAELEKQVAELREQRQQLEKQLADTESEAKRHQEDLRKLKDFLSSEAMAKAKEAPPAEPARIPDDSPTSARLPSCDVVICGPSGCGKSALVVDALSELNISPPPQMDPAEPFTPQTLNIPQADGSSLVLCEVPGRFLNSGIARRLYRGAHLIAVVYHPASNESLQACLQFLKMLTLSISTRGTSVCLVQNEVEPSKIVLESGSVLGNVAGGVQTLEQLSQQAQAFADENDLVFLRVQTLDDLVSQAGEMVEAKRTLKSSVVMKPAPAAPTRIPGPRTPRAARSALTIFYEKFRGFWDTINYKGQQQRLLRPTVVAPAGTKLPSLSLRRVATITDCSSAVTCVAFRPEKQEDEFVLLAVGRRDGTINIYHCFRTATEISVLQGADLDTDGCDVVDEKINMAESFRLCLHTKAVTCMSFSRVNADELMTTSVDCTIRAWNVSTGQLIKVFNDSHPGLAVIFHPVELSLFISCNSGPTIRIIDYNRGSVIQKIKTKSEVRTLCFDDTRINCITGSERGTVAVYESQGDMHLKLALTKQISRGPVTCVNFVAATSPKQAPCIIANICSGSIAVLNCVYDGTSGRICEISFRYSVTNNHVALPLRSCISSFGGGWCISGSEDRNLLIFNLQEENMPYNISFHAGPVVAVAVNQSDTVLVTSDSRGVVAIWRRILVVGDA